MRRRNSNPESEEPRDRTKDLLDEDLTKDIKETVRYAMRQGFSETTIRRTVEQVLNEARRG